MLWSIRHGVSPIMSNSPTYAYVHTSRRQHKKRWVLTATIWAGHLQLAFVVFFIIFLFFLNFMQKGITALEIKTNVGFKGGF